ncbi:MAG: phosphate ABC transporter permease subunit PstC [Sandaracinus sp.]
MSSGASEVSPPVESTPRESGELAPPRPSRAPRPRLGTSFRAPLADRIAEGVIRTLAFTAIAAIVLIFVFIAKEALPIFWEPDAQAHFGGLAALVEPRIWPGHHDAELLWQPVGDVAKMNVVPLFLGTLRVTVLALLIAVPLALLSAIYVSQYAPRRAREILKPAIELLASIPSVVLGFFALMVVATIVQDVFGLTYRLNALVAAIGLAMAVVPLVFTISEDALRAVPKELEAAALALGARKHQVVMRVVLPAALPGIAAAVILGLGRAIGETMVVLMASGNAAVMDVLSPGASARTVTATIASELGEVTQGDAHWRVLFLLGAILFVITFVLNRAGVTIVDRLHQRLTAATRGR